MRYLSLFSGIEAASVAWKPIGWECVGVAEIEKFPCAVLKHHYPDVPNLGDVTKITAKQIKALGKIDLVVGGFPCQDVSQAGKRKGLRNADGTVTRSGLFFDAMRLVRAADPRWLVIENVPGLFSSNRGRDFAAVVGEILGITVDVPRDGWRNAGAAASKRGLVEWAVLDAQFFGLAQRRQRVFLVADFGDWAGRPPILLERESLLGDFASRPKARQDVTGTLGARTTAGGGLGTDFDLGGGSSQPDGVIPANPLEGGVSHALTARHSATGRYDPNGETFIAFTSKDYGNDAQANLSPTLRAMGHAKSHANAGGQIAIAHTLTGGGFDASEDGTGRGPPLVIAQNGSDIQVSNSLGTLSASYERQTSGDVLCLPIAFDETQIISAENRSQPRAGDPSHPLAAGARPPTIAFNARQDPDPSGDKTHPLDTDGHSVAVAVALRGRDGGATAELGGDVSGALRASKGGGDKQHVMSAMTVRRITPTEAARLQGFSDDYLNITYRKKPAADGPKYRALGNSKATPVVRWIGDRIRAALRV